MIDPIVGKCKAISVWQMDGNDGTARVLATAYVDRVPMGSAIQWTFGKREEVDPRPSSDYFECVSHLHLKTHDSIWMHKDMFGRDDRKRNGRQSICKSCDAARKKMQALISVSDKPT